MTNNTDKTSAIARDELNALIAHTDACDLTDSHRSDDIHDIASTILSDYLLIDAEDIDRDYYRTEHPDIDTDDLADLIFELLSLIADDDTHSSTEYLSRLRLDFSICPIHHIDYAICFDDADPDCAQIRAAFPMHDT